MVNHFLIYEKRPNRDERFVVSGGPDVVAKYLTRPDAQRYMVYPTLRTHLIPVWARVLWLQRNGQPVSSGNPHAIFKILLALKAIEDLAQCTVHDVTVHFAGPRGNDCAVPRYPADEWLDMHCNLDLTVGNVDPTQPPASCVTVDAGCLSALVAALQWYADERNYSADNSKPVLKDQGQAARLALMQFG